VILAVLAGVGFGAFFLLVAQVEPGAVLAPLMIANLAALVQSTAGSWVSGNGSSYVFDNLCVLLGSTLSRSTPRGVTSKVDLPQTDRPPSASPRGT
jgi:hypothetical protein